MRWEGKIGIWRGQNRLEMSPKWSNDRFLMARTFTTVKTGFSLVGSGTSLGVKPFRVGFGV
ncbi:hypothetical protein HanXRQr2_Chr13g0607561 [Helianthus annuus]|uniref:Uncharacterized protein n=1 Tax=Helianthus annuus TaxID=4232 RepID=A0A251SVX1_HELAN|nr:hypothetical protein HanXRQr2_Chr13g0607561 [Helianthus annuus]KAJ0850868.1 hypothetical protein HanPSC8_Chr13g0585841 [Helianthus annuus]